MVADVLAAVRVPGQGVNQFHQTGGVEHSRHDARHLGAEHDVPAGILRVRLRMFDPGQAVLVLERGSVLIGVRARRARPVAVEEADEFEAPAKKFRSAGVLSRRLLHVSERTEGAMPARLSLEALAAIVPHPGGRIGRALSS